MHDGHLTFAEWTVIALGVLAWAVAAFLTGGAALLFFEGGGLLIICGVHRTSAPITAEGGQ